MSGIEKLIAGCIVAIIAVLPMTLYFDARSAANEATAAFQEQQEKMQDRINELMDEARDTYCRVS